MYSHIDDYIVIHSQIFKRFKKIKHPVIIFVSFYVLNSPCLFCQYLQTEVNEVTNAHTR
jgi:aryl-phospho-beta-D-glucosidase BglC (GH1 family)